MSGDLHIHTRLSDGSMGIEDIIALAGKRGIETIAITDHDCLAGTVRAKIIGERNGIKVIPGVELSAVDEETGDVVHILCYLPEYPDRLEGLCHKNTTAGKRAAQYMMIKAAQRYPVTPDVIKKSAAGSTNLFKQHIMHALMECGVTTGIYSDIHDELFTLSSESNILTRPTYASVREVIDTIHASEGIAIFAHPAISGGMDAVKRMVKLGIDGIEVWHPTADKETADEYAAFAKKNKLLVTGGSDFHGMYNKVPLTLGDYMTPKTQLAELLSYKSRKKRAAKKAAAAESAAETAGNAE